MVYHQHRPRSPNPGFVADARRLLSSFTTPVARGHRQHNGHSTIGGSKGEVLLVLRLQCGFLVLRIITSGILLLND